MASSSLQQMAPTLITRSKTLLNKDLQKICRAEGVATSGVKSQLQARVTDLINKSVVNNDHALFNRLQHHISNGPGAPAADYGSYPPRSATASSPNMPSGRASMANGYQQPNFGSYQTPATPARPQYFFKESPFFEIREMLLNNITLDTSPSHRQSVNKNLMLNESQSARLHSDSTLRVLLFCAVEQPLAPFTRLDIAFPSQIEVRVNLDEVKANYKGLKNKPGSTRPVDITDLLRTTPANYRNSIGITYALTQKKYNVFIYMVRKHSVEDLVKRIKNRSVITKESVLREMRKKAEDPDIEVGKTTMSLKDPISTLKINTPCRSTVCTHNRCFDGESFLQLQEQAPTWTCPICNKIISFEALAVDEYVQDILENVPRNTDQVNVMPDGQWINEQEPSAVKRQSNGNGNGYGYGYDDDDDDGDDSEEELVEIPDYRVTAIKSEAVPTPQSLPSIRTPPAPSREASSAPRTGSKRGSEVIDLTLSDDDEPRPKKVAYSTPNSVPDRMRQYQVHSYTVPRQESVRMDPPPAHSRHSFSGYRDPQSHSPHTIYPGQGTSAYPAYIDSSP
ncbi:E3 SUMO-protein ligase PIAS1 [Karstenula rhodostoma CBS 690.94]|uniref:E3 SUMO-protein ligase PIAS1 n=1 Tax=Karstenula rhodostoma CBS 690.94 TaxID=1392251 RepID=A0A9P4PL74_9PLEO|nr:E3 SUMO-protein ligase PIAS1 [Karstenula rhodostoma CBS 690.94]